MEYYLRTLPTTTTTITPPTIIGSDQPFDAILDPSGLIIEWQFYMDT